MEGCVADRVSLYAGTRDCGTRNEGGESRRKFKAGDLAAIGCMVDSDGTCPACKAGEEQFCPDLTLTYNAPDKYLGGVTYGGYSDSIVVTEHFALHVPENLNPAGAAPLLCAGITTYSPMRHRNVGNGTKVGVLGLGRPGHMGVKFAHALGAHTVVFTTSENKREDALRLGADEEVLSRDRSQMQKHAMSFDFILDTIAADHDLNAYLQLLKQDGNLTLIGIPEKPLAVAPFSLIRTAQSVGLAHTVVATFSSKICDLSQFFERCGTLSHWQPYCI
jgi:uncharacterized zinc-type alcohol dehydrogenase-like protein